MRHAIPILLLITNQAVAQSPAQTADSTLGYHDDYKRGISALADGLPEVAANKLARVLDIKNLPSGVADDVRLKLAEAYVRSGRHADAIAILDQPSLTANPVSAYWSGQANAAEGHLNAALENFNTVTASAEATQAHRNSARFAIASILTAVGQPGDALATLQPLLDPEADPPVPRTDFIRASLRAAEIHLSQNRASLASTLLESLSSVPGELAPAFTYLRATTLIAAGLSTEALTALDNLPEDSPVSPDLRPKLALARSRALAATGKPGLAIQTLVTFVSDSPSSPFLDLVFAQLETAGAFDTADTLPQLEAWIASPNATLSSLAKFYTALTLHNTGDTGSAIAAIQAFRTTDPSGPLTDRTAVELASWLIASGKSDESIALLDPLIAVETPAPLKAHANFLRAQAHVAAGELTEAANAFAAAGAEDTPGASAASYNAAIATLRAQQDAEFASRAALLKTSPQTTDLHARLLLERSLFAFSSGRDDAVELANAFLEQYPGHTDAYRIRIALAEHAAFTFFPAKMQTARDHLTAARKSAPLDSPAIAERLDYIAFRIAGSADDPAPLLALGTAFLEKWPASGNLDRVRMKLGETHFRLGDFPNARLQFEKLADQAPSSPLAEPALFFAARAALGTISPDSLDAAITLLQRVTDLEGPLAPYAREQQALAQRRLGRNDEAVLIYESILNATPPPAADLRISALIGLGEARFDQGRDDPQLITAALEAFEQILTDTSATLAWKHRALYHKGKALEKLERTDDALEAYYDIISTPESTPRVASPAEQVWFYRAGFEAVSILEAAEKWRAAISIADRLATAGGPRATEAKDRAERLRLEHLVWDE